MKVNWTNIAIAGIGAGVVLYLFGQAKKGGEALINTVAKPIADSILFLTLPGEVRLRGDVVFPDGSRILINDVRLDDEARFVYRGVRWQIYSRNGASFLAQKA